MSTREFRVSVSARGSPLQRASFHWLPARAPSPCNRTSIREPCYTLRPARGNANFCYSCWSRSATCNFSGRGYMYFCQRSSKYSQYIYSSRTVRSRWAWPPLATHQSFAQEKTASEAKRASQFLCSSCSQHHSSTNFEAPAANLAISMDLPGNHIILDMAQTPLEFGVVPLLPPARRNWSGVAPFSISPNADTHMATIRLGKHETVSEVAGLGVYGALPWDGWCH